MQQTVSSSMPRESQHGVRSRIRVSTLVQSVVLLAQAVALGMALFLLSLIVVVVWHPDWSQDSLWLLLMGLDLWVSYVGCVIGVCLGAIALLRREQPRYAIFFSTMFCSCSGVLLMDLLFHKLLIPS